MRERCPVAFSTFLGWSLFRHSDIVGVLADSELYSSISNHRAVPNGMDPPVHTHFRQALEPMFHVERMTAFEPHCRRTAAELVGDLMAASEFDFVSEFAQPFSMKALCAFLGWPPDAWKSLLGWTHGNQAAALSRNRKDGKALALEFAGYVERALQTRRRSGAQVGDDFTDHLMRIEVEGEPLDDEDIVSVLRNWTAGHGTVAAALGILMYFLADNDDAQKQLRAEPALLPAAIEEILRADGPLVANRRTTTRGVEIGGRTIGAGEKLTLNWIAANRDDRVFSDPGKVRFNREHSANLLFGAGIHDCLGAPLARLEMRAAMEELLARTSSIKLGAVQSNKRDVYPGNGFSRLPVRLL